jgi:hypothetical protein
LLPRVVADAEKIFGVSEARIIGRFESSSCRTSTKSASGGNSAQVADFFEKTVENTGYSNWSKRQFHLGIAVLIGLLGQGAEK